MIIRSCIPKKVQVIFPTDQELEEEKNTETPIEISESQKKSSFPAGNFFKLIIFKIIIIYGSNNFLIESSSSSIQKKSPPKSKPLKETEMPSEQLNYESTDLSSSEEEPLEKDKEESHSPKAPPLSPVEKTIVPETQLSNEVS